MKTQSLPPGAAAPPVPYRSGSEIIVDTLRQLGVDIVFGYPGASVIPLFDRLYQQRSAASGFVRILPQAGRCLRRAGEDMQQIRKNPYL